MSACGCSPCGREFTGLGAFDRHQDVDYARTPPVVCLDPAERGLVIEPRTGRWGFPVDASTRARFKALAAEQASGVVPSGAGGPRPSEVDT